MEENSQVVTAEAEKAAKKKRIEELCKKIMSVVIPCIVVLMVLLMIFEGSKEARGVKSALKDEGCKTRLLTASEEISEFLDEMELELKNIDEVVVAVDKDDDEIFAIVFFCESRMDAEDAERYCTWLLFDEPSSYDYSVERNAKVVCFGHEDLVDAAMKELD